MPGAKILTARDIMTTRGVVLRPELGIFKAIPILVKYNLTGCPVTGSNGRLLGILSELDCMKIIASDAFHSDAHSEEILVKDFMTTDCISVAPDLGIFGIAQLFFTHTLRRLPVVQEDILVGQVTRSDVLKGIQRMRKARQSGKNYPDFSWPSSVMQ